MATPRQEVLNVAGGLIGVGIVSILGFITWALVFRAIPVENETAMNVLLGILASQVNLVVGFFFGSSVSNKKQSETIDTLASTAKSAQAALHTPDSALLIPTGGQATASATPDGTIIEREANEK